MICPYVRTSEVEISQSSNDLVDKETGVLRGYQQIVIKHYTMAECARKQCGAWHWGRCRYKNK